MTVSVARNAASATAAAKRSVWPVPAQPATPMS